MSDIERICWDNAEYARAERNKKAKVRDINRSAGVICYVMSGVCVCGAGLLAGYNHGLAGLATALFAACMLISAWHFDDESRK